MAYTDRVLRANRTILAVPVYEKADGSLVIVSPTGTTCPFFAPTSVVLDAWRQVLLTSQTGAAQGGNISCAVLDDVSLGLGDSDTDTELTICSIGNEQTPTFANIEAEITVFRDASKADTGVFNLATFLLCSADIRYGFVDRIGYSSTTAFATGQDINVYDSYTDVPVDVIEDRGNLKLQNSPAPTGNFIDRYTLAS